MLNFHNKMNSVVATKNDNFMLKIRSNIINFLMALQIKKCHLR